MVLYQIQIACQPAVNHIECAVFSEQVFCMKECGDNALEVLYGLENGAVYSDYAVIPFDMKEVRVSDKKGKRVISDYEELKEWWNNEK